jgi:flagellar biosynthetic protein FliR
MALGSGVALDFGTVLLVGALCSARMVPVLILAPFFGGRLVPAVAKMGLAAALAVILFPRIAAAIPVVGPVEIALLFAKELFVGLAIGLAASLLFQAAEAAGRLVDIGRGASLAEVLVPQSGTGASPTGELYFQLAVVVFLATGGHRLFLAALGHSYEVVPLTVFPGAHGLAALAGGFIDLTAGLLAVALGLAAPVLIAAVLTDVSLGLVNRVAPQLNAFVLGLPMKALIGAAVVLLGISVVGTEIVRGGATVLTSVEDVIRALGR